MEVADLFFNTPARRKFLKTERTELLHIQEAVRRIALGQPRRRLRVGGRQPLAGRPDRRQQGGARPSAVRQPLHGGVRGHRRTGRRHAAARLGGPANALRWRATRQQFYVNGRSVKDRLAGHAVRQAYRDVLFHGRHPVFALFFELAPRAGRCERPPQQGRSALPPCARCSRLYLRQAGQGAARSAARPAARPSCSGAAGRRRRTPACRGARPGCGRTAAGRCGANGGLRSSTASPARRRRTLLGYSMSSVARFEKRALATTSRPQRSTKGKCRRWATQWRSCTASTCLLRTPTVW